jgi:hypothetical protein
MHTVTIQLPRETEERLREKASLSGKSIETFVQELAERAARETTMNGTVSTPATSPELSTDEWITAWRAFVDTRPSRPVIADDSRESIYEGRGE